MNSLWQFDFSTANLELKFGEKNPLTPDEMINRLPDGVYTTLRTKGNNSAFQLRAHLFRLEEGLILSGYNFPYSIDLIREPIYNIFVSQKEQEHRVRLHIPFTQLSCCSIIVEDLLAPPESKYNYGVAVTTTRLGRVDPQIKKSTFVQKSKEERGRINTQGFEESILLDENDFLLEGLSSNFFVIIGETIFTAGAGVLSGVTRNIVLEEMTAEKFSIDFQPIHLNTLPRLSEAFITSTTRKVMPVVRINNQTIGNGSPGPITKRIMQGFNARFNNEFEAIYPGY